MISQRGRLTMKRLDILLLRACRQRGGRFDAFNLDDGRCAMCRQDFQRVAAIIPPGERVPLLPAAAVSGLPPWCEDCAAKARYHREGEAECR